MARRKRRNVIDQAIKKLDKAQSEIDSILGQEGTVAERLKKELGINVEDLKIGELDKYVGQLKK